MAVFTKSYSKTYLPALLVFDTNPPPEMGGPGRIGVEFPSRLGPLWVQDPDVTAIYRKI